MHKVELESALTKEKHFKISLEVNGYIIVNITIIIIL